MDKPIKPQTKLPDDRALKLRLVEATTVDLPDLLPVLVGAYAEYQGKLDPPSGAHAEIDASQEQHCRWLSFSGTLGLQMYP